MKRIEAVFPSDNCDAVKKALKNMGLNATIVRVGEVGEKEIVTQYRGATYVKDEVQMAMALLVVADDVVDVVCNTIRKAAHYRPNDDGLITVSEISKVIRIKDGQTGEAALSYPRGGVIFTLPPTKPPKQHK